MKKFLAILSAVFLTFLVGCTNEKETPKTFILPEGYSLIKQDLPTGVKVDGIGVEFDPHFFSQNTVRNVPGLTNDKWEIFADRVTRMKVNKFRVMILPHWLEPVNDNSDSSTINWDALTPDSLEMQSLKKTLDLAQNIGADVTLVLWGVPVNITLAADNYASKPYFMSSNHLYTKNWVVAPKGTMEEEFCENFSAYIQYLVNEKKYTCITEITPVNEPNWSYQVDKVVDMNGYLRLCKKLDTRFKNDNIRDLVKFNLVDSDRSHNVVIEEVANKISEITDITNSHCYSFGYTSKNSEIIEWTKNDSVLSNSFSEGHFIGEFGSNLTVGSTKQEDIATYERGVLIVRLMLNFFNGGANGVSYWSLGDQYYNAKASYDEMMQTGLWYSAKEEYRSDMQVFSLIKKDFDVKKQYYAYSLMTSQIPRNSAIYPLIINSEFCAGTRFAKDSGDVYAFANGDETSYKFAFQAEENTKWNVYMYEKNSLPQDDSLLPVLKQITAKDLCVAFEVPANTAVLVKKAS